MTDTIPICPVCDRTMFGGYLACVCGYDPTDKTRMVEHALEAAMHRLRQLESERDAAWRDLEKLNELNNQLRRLIAGLESTNLMLRREIHRLDDRLLGEKTPCPWDMPT
jgi:predicted RNase H-like nuclease (RuvC/YqgF family)